MILSMSAEDATWRDTRAATDNDENVRQIPINAHAFAGNRLRPPKGTPAKSPELNR